MKEIWKDIIGYEGYYQISDHGRVKSVERMIDHNKSTGVKRKICGRILTLHPKPKGYLIFIASKNGITKTCNVHRVVAELFVPNPDNLPEVNHIDENKKNNHFKNLQWVTHIENIRYGTGIRRSTQYKTGRINPVVRGENHPNSKLKSAQVICIYRDNRSYSKIAKEYNVDISTVYAIKRHKTWNHLFT